MSADGFEAVYAALLAERGGEGNFGPVDRANARTLALLMASPRDGDPIRHAEVMVKLQGMLPVKATTSGTDLSKLTDDQLAEFEKLFAIVRGEQPPSPIEEPAPFMGGHYPGRSGCGCAVCSPAELGDELQRLRSENAALKDELYRAGTHARSPADPAGLATPATVAAPVAAAAAAVASVAANAPFAAPNVVPLTREAALAVLRPVHREEPWESHVRGGIGRTGSVGRDYWRDNRR
jgi:hypothetical protein